MSIETRSCPQFRPRGGITLLSIVTLLVVACSDGSAPGESLLGAVAIAPRVMARAAGIVDVSEVQINLTRLADGTVAKDTAVMLSPGDTTVEITITLVLERQEERFELDMALVNSSGEAVFRGGPTIVTAAAHSDPVPVEVDLVYTGVGADAAGVQILSADTLITSGDEILLTAVALDSNDTPMAAAPVAWRSLDTARVSVPQTNIGRAVGGSERGVARIVAQLLTYQADTVLLTAQPAPTDLIAESGDGQTGFADSLLPVPPTARVLAADGLGVAGVWVRYAVAQGGGAVSADSVLSDGDGRTSVTWRLGVEGPQKVEVTSAALPLAAVVFTATATMPPQPLGPQITFFSDSAGRSGLYRVTGDGSGLSLIVQRNGDYPQWSPSRERVAYTSGSLLYVTASDGSGSAALTTSMEADRPRFSPTGQRLAYACASSIYDWPEICVVPDVSGPIASLVGLADVGKVLVMDSIASDAAGPGAIAWDPQDPDRIAFFRDSLDTISSDRVYWLYASRYDGSALELLTPAYLQYQGTPLSVGSTMEWSPDGQQIAFTGNGALYLIDRDGTGLSRLTIGAEASNQEYDYDPRFSPDGQQIAFVRRIRYFNAQATDVWAINTDGTNLRQLTADQHPYTETRVSVDWSPDGSELVVIGAVAPPTDYSVAAFVIPVTSSPETYLQVRRRVGRIGDSGAIAERHPMWRP